MDDKRLVAQVDTAFPSLEVEGRVIYNFLLEKTG